MTGVRVWVEAAELLGPGLPSWDTARAVLAGHEPYVHADFTLPPPPQLSPAERRRAIPSVRLALAVGAAAIAGSGLDPATMPAVFASSGADGQTIGGILSALALPSREVSPTGFHNSVHNAPSGYWSLAVRSREPVTSLSAHDGSFAAGLLEAAAQTVCGNVVVLLVAYDLPYPEPLHGVRPIAASFGVALVLSPARSARSLAELRIATIPMSVDEATECGEPRLEWLRRGNPAARSLPLLEALAASRGGLVRLQLARGGLGVGVTPC